MLHAATCTFETAEVLPQLTEQHFTMKVARAQDVHAHTYMIPPALSKIWQLRLKCVLHQLKADADHAQNKHITDNQRLEGVKCISQR